MHSGIRHSGPYPVRRGSCISPAIFNVFINLFITRLRDLGVGCSISSIFLGCILLLSPTVSGLQNMLDKCSKLPQYCH